MKNRKVILACIFILLSSLSSNAQDTNNNTGLLNKLSFRIGLATARFNNSDSYANQTGLFNIMASVTYDYKPQLKVDFMYHYFSGVSRFLNGASVYNDLQSYGYTNYQVFNSNMFSLKANYFLSKDRSVNPVYFTGGITCAVQPVHEYYSGFYNGIDSLQNYSSSFNFKQTNYYTRLLLGPEIGTGLYFDLGKVSFQTELTYSARFSLFRDRGYRELSFSLFNGIVYKF